MLLGSKRPHILGGQQAVGSVEVSQADAQRRRGISACSSMPVSFMQPIALIFNCFLYYGLV